MKWNLWRAAAAAGVGDRGAAVIGRHHRQAPSASRNRATGRAAVPAASAHAGQMTAAAVSALAAPETVRTCRRTTLDGRCAMCAWRTGIGLGGYWSRMCSGDGALAWAAARVHGGGRIRAVRGLARRGALKHPGIWPARPRHDVAPRSGRPRVCRRGHSHPVRGVATRPASEPDSSDRRRRHKDRPTRMVTLPEPGRRSRPMRPDASWCCPARVVFCR